MKLFMRLVFRVLGKGVKPVGAEHVPQTGGVLFCPNHISDADPPAVAIALPRNAWFMAKSELFSIPILGALVRHWHGFPVRRDTADRAALRRAEELLKAGEAVVIFPEGGGNEDATLQPLYPGAMLVALRVSVPVIPVAIVNTHRIWPYGAVLPHRAAGVPVTVTFGEPIDFADLRGKRGAAELATARLTKRLATMLDQPVPPGKPKPHREEPEEGGAVAENMTARGPSALAVPSRL
jgi:1-acyl-sn-glycerol-3-phosphate acyltransferase